MAVISGDDDEGLLEHTKLLQLGDGCLDSVVQLQEVTEGAVVVHGVHLLVDARRLRHEEETIITTPVVQDLHRLHGHILQTGQVRRPLLATEGVVLHPFEVLLVDVAVEPDGHVALAKDAKGLLVGVRGQKGGPVGADGETLVSELLVVVLALVRALASKELLGATAEVDVGPVILRPGVVGLASEGLVDDGAVEVSVAGVSAQGGRGGVGEGGRGDGAPDGSLRVLVSSALMARRILVDLPICG